MRNLFILLLAFSLVTACNNDKGGPAKKADYREKDDYSNTDDKNTDDKNTGDNKTDEQSKDKSKKDEDQQDYTGNDGWSEKDKSKFLTDCMGTSPDNQEKAKKVCSCVLEKLEKKYTSLSEADAKGGEAEGRKMATECMEELNITNNNNDNNNNGNDNNKGNDNDDYSHGGWSSQEVKNFVTTCVKAAEKNGMEYLDAQSYCDCMQDKLAKIYPNARDADKLTNADFSTPAMKKMVKSCLPGN